VYRCENWSLTWSEKIDWGCLKTCWEWYWVLRDEVTNGKNCTIMTSSVSKVKQSRYTPWRRLGGRGYRSYSFTTSALDGGEWTASRPSRALPPEKGSPVPIVQEAGWAPELMTSSVLLISHKMLGNSNTRIMRWGDHTHRGNDKYVQNFGHETWRENTTLKI
jgi:hypothetical protein